MNNVFILIFAIGLAVGCRERQAEASPLPQGMDTAGQLAPNDQFFRSIRYVGIGFRSVNDLVTYGTPLLPAQIHLNDESLIPAGYKKIRQETGDLNEDGITDFAIVVGHKDEDSLALSPKASVKRRLMLFLVHPDGTCQLAAESDRVVLGLHLHGAWGEPLQQLMINKGYLTVLQCGGSGLRWYHDFVFKYDQAEKNWFLHEEIKRRYQSTDAENFEFEKLTANDFGKVSFSTFNVYDR